MMSPSEPGDVTPLGIGLVSAVAAFLAARAAAIFCASFESGLDGDSFVIASAGAVLDDAGEGADGAGDDLAEAAARLCSARSASFDLGFAGSDAVSAGAVDFEVEVKEDEEAFDGV